MLTSDKIKQEQSENYCKLLIASLTGWLVVTGAVLAVVMCTGCSATGQAIQQYSDTRYAPRPIYQPQDYTIRSQVGEGRAPHYNPNAVGQREDYNICMRNRRLDC